MTDRRRAVLPAFGLLLAGLGSIAAAAVLDPGVADEAARLVATMLRVTIACSGAYAVVLATLTLLAELFGWGRAMRWSLRLGAVRLGLAAGVAVASLGSAAITTTAPAAAADVAPAPVDTDTPPVASITPIDPPVASLVPLPAHDMAQPTPTERPTWTVEQGDHLWAIAEAQVGDADDRVVHDYWVRLVELNTDRLVVPGDPDLIVPGQELLLPER